MRPARTGAMVLRAAPETLETRADILETRVPAACTPGAERDTLWQARAYLQMESYDDAASDLERVVELDPSQAAGLAADIAQV